MPNPPTSNPLSEGERHERRLLANARRRVERARLFPINTCPASRHLDMIAAALSAGKPYVMLSEDPRHCALTMLSVIESLWKARTKLAALSKADSA